MNISREPEGWYIVLDPPRGAKGPFREKPYVSYGILFNLRVFEHITYYLKCDGQTYFAHRDTYDSRARVRLDQYFPWD